MRPPTSLHEKRIGGPQNFRPPVQNDFCNSIGPSRHFAATQQTVALGGKATVRELLIALNSCARARYSDRGSISVGASSGAREVRSW